MWPGGSFLLEMNISSPDSFVSACEVWQIFQDKLISQSLECALSLQLLIPKDFILPPVAFCAYHQLLRHSHSLLSVGFTFQWLFFFSVLRQGLSHCVDQVGLELIEQQIFLMPSLILSGGQKGTPLPSGGGKTAKSSTQNTCAWTMTRERYDTL